MEENTVENPTEKQLRLDVKTTVYIAFGFFSILMLWQVYNAYIPLFLARLLDIDQAINPEDAWIVGFIMALDNIFALIMLPIFGILSDRTRSRHGRRMPYIILGMLAAAIVFPFIVVMYYLNSFWGVIIVMLMVLIIMNIYRNPAVALMPDVTPKPLRSKANGIINLIGYVGAIIGGGLLLVFGENVENPLLNLIPFSIVSAFMLVAMVVLFVKIKENKLVAEKAEDMMVGEKESEAIGVVAEDVPLSKSDLRNVWLILVSVFLWFAAFNAIETFHSTYAEEVLGDAAIGGAITIVLVMASLVAFIPSAILASFIGRKWTIVSGLAVMMGGLFLCMLVNEANVVFFSGIVFAGFGWAMINVNSYPMIVETAHKNNIGKFTGFYYTSSMLAQSFTPVVAGWVIGWVSFFGFSGYEVLFPYAFVLVGFALVVFFFILEKKDKPKDIKKGIEAFDVDLD